MREGGQPPRYASSEAPIRRIVITILMYAINDKAREVEVVPTKDHVFVRWEIDGVLDDRMKLPTYILPPVVARIKKLGDMSIEECQAPQTGHAHVRMRDKDYNLYIQTSPTEWGEKVTIGIAPKPLG